MSASLTVAVCRTSLSANLHTGRNRYAYRKVNVLLEGIACLALERCVAGLAIHKHFACNDTSGRSVCKGCNARIKHQV